MRFIVGNIEQARSKAKFLQKCLARFGIERSLTQCQGYLATSFSFNSWAELKGACSKTPGEAGAVDIRQFRKMVSNKFDIDCHTNIHAYAIFARMGFCQSVHHFDFRFDGFYRELISVNDAAVALELIFERYLEIDPHCPEVDGLIAMAQAIVSPYVDVHPGSFELMATTFIDQMKALRIPGISYLGDQLTERDVDEVIAGLPDCGVITLSGEDRGDIQASAVILMRLARKKVKIAFPLTWLVGKSSPLAGAIYYLPALTDGGRRLVDQIGPTNRILVVDNAPMDAAPISIGNLG
jgi:hypothetical protein